LLVGVPSVGLAVQAAYGAESLTTGLVDAAVISQGRDMAIIVIACTLGALVGRAVLLPLDARLAALRGPRLRLGVRVGMGATALAAVVVGAPPRRARSARGPVRALRERWHRRRRGA
jgi:hypothetical protein